MCVGTFQSTLIRRDPGTDALWTEDCPSGPPVGKDARQLNAATPPMPTSSCLFNYLLFL